MFNFKRKYLSQSNNHRQKQLKNATAWTNGQQKEVSGIVINYISKMQHHYSKVFFWVSEAGIYYQINYT